MRRKLLVFGTALTLAAAMMFCGTVSAFAEDTAEVSVEVSIQKGDVFYMAHNQLKVKSDLAENYGYEDQVEPGKVSALDALVAAHIDRYGADIKTVNEKLAMSYGNPSLMMGEGEGNYSGFAINEDYVVDEATGYGSNVDSAVVESGDRLDFFWYEDVNWGDYVSVFTDGDNKVFDKEVKAGESISLTLKGFMFMNGYSKPGYSPINGAELCILDENGKAEPLLREGNKIITDKEGSAEITFDTAGTYYLTAKDNSFGFRIVMPWCKITVNENKPVVEEETTEPTAKKEQGYVEESTDNGINNSGQDNEKKQVTTDGTVKTGDSFNISLLAVVMIIAAAGAFAVVFVRRRES